MTTSWLAPGWRRDLALFAGVFLTRVPFLGPGYGLDPDAWRVVDAARSMRDTGVFHASRVPGHPVAELVSALLVPGGALVLNGFGAVLSALAVVLFARLLERARQPVWPGALALTFTASFYVYGTTPLDFVFALPLLLGAWLLVLERRLVGAAVLVGLAGGCRNTSLLMLVPLTWLALAGRAAAERPRALLSLWSPALAVAVLSFVPVVHRYGLGYALAHFEDPYPSWAVRLGFSGMHLWGLVGGGLLTLALVQATLRRWRRAHELGPEPPGMVGAAVVAVVAYGVLFLRLPHESIYLLPALPFLYLLLTRALPLAGGFLVAAGLALSCFGFWIEPQIVPVRLRAPFGRPFTLAGFPLRIMAQGPVLADHRARGDAVGFAEESLRRARALPSPAVVVAGRWQPVLRNLPGGTLPPGVRIAYLLDASDVTRAAAAGERIYYLPQQYERNLGYHGVDLRQHGAEPLFPEYVSTLKVPAKRGR